MSGDFIVEEVEGDGGQLFRRLIFLNNQGVIQSEACLKLCMYLFYLLNTPGRAKISKIKCAHE